LAELLPYSYIITILKLITVAVEGTNVPGDDLLFDKEFLENSVDNAFVPPRNFDARCSKFRLKYLNIIDPLKECNNLGRSVNRGLN
jgi:NhaP-type Na+/H+ or K+/H+ antiporter